jgi:hypothetical protein
VGARRYERGEPVAQRHAEGGQPPKIYARKKYLKKMKAAFDNQFLCLSLRRYWGKL